MKNYEAEIFHKGDLYLCEFSDVGGSVENGIRPAVILQNNSGNKYSSTLIVSPVSSVIKKYNQPTHIYLGKKYGLKTESMILLEQIFTVDKNIHVKEFIGTIKDPNILKQINKGLVKSLSIKNLYSDFAVSSIIEKAKNRKENTLYLCLCHKCREAFEANKQCNVGTVKYSEHIKDKCDFCNSRYGYDCVIKIGE